MCAYRNWCQYFVISYIWIKTKNIGFFPIFFYYILNLKKHLHMYLSFKYENGFGIDTLHLKYKWQKVLISKVSKKIFEFI